MQSVVSVRFHCYLVNQVMYDIYFCIGHDHSSSWSESQGHTSMQNVS